MRWLPGSDRAQRDTLSKKRQEKRWLFTSVFFSESVLQTFHSAVTLDLLLISPELIYPRWQLMEMARRCGTKRGGGPRCQHGRVPSRDGFQHRRYKEWRRWKEIRVKSLDCSL